MRRTFPEHLVCHVLPIQSSPVLQSNQATQPGPPSIPPVPCATHCHWLHLSKALSNVRWALKMPTHAAVWTLNEIAYIKSMYLQYLSHSKPTIKCYLFLFLLYIFLSCFFSLHSTLTSLSVSPSLSHTHTFADTCPICPDIPSAV